MRNHKKYNAPVFWKGIYSSIPVYRGRPYLYVDYNDNLDGESAIDKGYSGGIQLLDSVKRAFIRYS